MSSSCLEHSSVNPHNIAVKVSVKRRSKSHPYLPLKRAKRVVAKRSRSSPPSLPYRLHLERSSSNSPEACSETSKPPPRKKLQSFDLRLKRTSSTESSNSLSVTSSSSKSHSSISSLLSSISSISSALSVARTVTPIVPELPVEQISISPTLVSQSHIDTSEVSITILQPSIQNASVTEAFKVKSFSKSIPTSNTALLEFFD